MKSLFRLFFSLCFLLLSGYSNTYAHPLSDLTPKTALSALEKSEKASVSILQNSRTLTIRHSVPVKENDNYRLKATEIEEENETEKSSSSKKHLSIGSYLATFFYAQTTDNLCRCIKIRLSFSKHFPFASLSRHLEFGVFRI